MSDSSAFQTQSFSFLEHRKLLASLRQPMALFIRIILGFFIRKKDYKNASVIIANLKWSKTEDIILLYNSRMFCKVT